MKIRSIFAAVAASIILTACGGGSDSSNDPVVATPEPQGQSCCASPLDAKVTKVAATSIRLDGNSVMHGAQVVNGVIYRTAVPPVATIYKTYNNIPLWDYSVNGISVQGIRGSNFWPPVTCASHHIILEYHNNLLSNFREQLNAMINESCSPVKILVVANVPSLSVNPAWADIYEKANIVREVALERGIKLCDPYLGSSYNHPDGMHLNDLGYKILGDKIVQCIKETSL